MPVAFWGDGDRGQLVNNHGEVFTATMTVPPRRADALRPERICATCWLLPASRRT